MSKSVLVPIADGTEEIEAVTVIDVLRRAGAQVVVASVGLLQITASRGVKLVADCLIADCQDRIFDLVVLPGGMPGTEHLHNNTILKTILMRQHAAGRLYAAICAAPAVILAQQGLLKGRKSTAHPSFVNRLPDTSSAAARVVVDGNCITSRGPGTAMAFSLELVSLLFGQEKMKAVADPMVVCACDGIKNSGV